MSEMIAEQKAAALPRIADFLKQYAGVAGHTQDARDELKNVTDAQFGKREALYLAAADVAFKASWSDDAVSAAIDQALLDARTNNPKTAATLKTFAAELNLVMGSTVRGHIPSLFNTGRAAWAAEIAAVEKNSDAPQPLKKLWSRQTLMLVGLARKIKTGKFTFPDAQSIVFYAVANDPAKDNEKIERRLKAAAKVISGIYADFPMGVLSDVAKFLNDISATQLQAARDKMLAEQNGEEQPEQPSNLRKAEPAPAEPAPVSDAPSDVIAEFNNLTNAA